MAKGSGFLERLEGYFGARKVPERVAQERLRAIKRSVGAFSVSAVWAAVILSGHANSPPLWAVGVPLMFGLVSWAYGHMLRRPSSMGLALLYAFVIADPVAIVGVLSQIPEIAELLNPFLLTVIVASGIRYGVRTMYLGWAATLIALLVVFLGNEWHTDYDLASSFVLMLALIPLYFSGLIRQIHNVRAIEAERARLKAMNEGVLARNAFLAKVSHELRSPLQGILSALDVFELRHGRANDQDNELIGRMRRSSLLLNTQLRDLLTLAKGEVGRLEMHPAPLEALALVEAMADGALDLARAKGLELVVDLPADPLFVVADGARIDQVLTNLVNNSIRYTDFGQVRIALHGHDAASGCLRFVVADTGPGIPEAVLPTLFAPDKFMTGAERRGEGSGIGLAIVRTLIDHLGGKIAVTSLHGRGTTFTLDIPAEPIDALAAADTEPGELVARILVVDDRDDVLDALVSLVDELGYECDRASSAAIGANLLAAKAYDAILLDIDMPIKGGDQLAAETRRGKGPNRDSRFIGMSAAEATAGVQAQFHTCIAKPIDRAALRRALIGVGHFLARPSQPGLWTED